MVEEYSNKLFEKVLSIEIEERRKAIKNIKNDLELFEQKYNMSTEEFYNILENGEFGDDHINENAYFHALELRKYTDAMDGVRNLVKQTLF